MLAFPIGGFLDRSEFRYAYWLRALLLEDGVVRRHFEVWMAEEMEF